MKQQFRLRASEPTAAGLRRLLTGQLALARTHLNAGATTPLDIHRFRQHIKHARATLRLLRSGLDREQFRLLDDQLAASARAWGTLRDAQVTERQLQQAGIDTRLSAVESTPSNLRKLCRQSVAQVRLVEAAVRAWRTTLDGETLLQTALERSYRGGQKAFRRACSTNRERDWHHFRHHVQYLSLQLQMLRSYLPPATAPQQLRAAELGKKIGQRQDLKRLREYLSTRKEEQQKLPAIDIQKRKHWLTDVKRLADQVYPPTLDPSCYRVYRRSAGRNQPFVRS